MKLNITSLLAKIEGTYGVDSNPTGAANAILLRGQPTLTPMDVMSDERNNILPYFGNMGSIPGSAFGQLDCEIELAGSGTAGVAPGWGVLARACALSETLTAAAITGTAQAGGSTTTVKLAAAASAVNDFYNGMPISITAGTGNGQSGLIVDYDGTSKIATVLSAAWVAPDATSSYSIGANAAYRPVTQNLESATLYFNIDGVLHKFLGARGNFAPSITAEKIPSAKVTLQGMYVPVADGAVPTLSLGGYQRPLLANSTNTPLFVMHGFTTAVVDSLSIDLANAIAKVSRIGAGAQRVDITNRKPTGSVSMEAVTVATKDWFAACRANTPGSLGLIHGTVDGNKFAISAPAVIPNQPKYADSNGVAMLQMNMDITPVSGNDEFNLVTF